MVPARDIYQTFLDVTSQALWIRDYERLAARMAYPHQIGARDRVVTISTPAELINVASDFRENLGELGATAYYRVCREAERLDDDDISGMHTAYALRGATPVIEPFQSRMRIRRVDGRWLGAGIASSVRNADIRVNIASPAIEIER